MSKKERTTQFILEKVAPIFNKNGYVATSMGKVSSITGLSKGSVYSNFDSKEDLAIKAFNYNIKKVMGYMKTHLDKANSALDKLKAITNFYRKYYDYTITFGGCPLLNVGVDANYQNPALLARVRHVIKKLESSIARIIEEGVVQGEFKPEIMPKTEVLARSIFASLEGAIYMSVTLENTNYLLEMVDQIDRMIENELVLVPKST
ncbi:TetR/AcrR family transcriptional regulator [Flammeovirgaceae bacterium SG7u.111]|nr:TetR/AcrR family transcriptional regulator [Flammeovirgaceae bacterium SG7u.132]WPO34403.1 TetR/AcrR family transcriptional regulator [Flammeovirgaceae bacterium SG7u.111]